MNRAHLQFILIDDDCDDCDIFCEAIGEVSRSAKCLVYNDPEIAYRELSVGGIIPDFIFLDLNMPKLNGKKLLVEIKKLRALKNIPVIIYTTSSDQQDIDETKRLGASHFITKPYDFNVLCDEIRGVMKIKSMIESR